MQVPYLGRAPRTKETLPDFLKWRRVTRPPLVFRGLTGSQRTPGFWGVTGIPDNITILLLIRNEKLRFITRSGIIMSLDKKMEKVQRKNPRLLKTHVLDVV